MSRHDDPESSTPPPCDPELREALLSRVLLVEDDERLGRALEQTLRVRFGATVTVTTNVADALAALAEGPRLMLLDVHLPDGSALAIIDAARHLAPQPCVVAMSGTATAREAYELGVAGVRAFLVKPLGPRDLEAAIESVLTEPPMLDAHAAASVGHAPMAEVLERVRLSMLDQAIGLTEGNRSGAARLLRVTRQAVQYAMRSSTDEDAS